MKVHIRRNVFPEKAPAEKQPFPDGFNILRLSARPGRSLDDVRYTLISKPVWDISNASKLTNLTLLAFLEARDPGFYTIVHLDVHAVIDKKG